MSYFERSSSRRRRRLAAATLLLLTLAAAAGAVEPGPHPDHLLVVEGRTLVFTVDQLLDNDLLSGEPFGFVVLDPPDHGSLVCGFASCSYQPDDGWYGVDGFRYGVSTQTAGYAGDARVEVWVSPLVTPLAGDWNGDGLTDLGWFHAERLDFHFALLERQGDLLRVGETSCARSGLPDGAEGSVPLAGDWDGDGDDEVAVFDPRSRTFHQFDSDRWGLFPASTFGYPAAGFGGLPVAGDWAEGGADEVGLFLPAEHRFELLTAAPGGGHAVGFSFVYALPSGDWFPLAAKLGSFKDGPDRVAVWSPAGRELHYRLDFAGGPTAVIDDYDVWGIGPRALPFGGRWEAPESVGFFDPDQVTTRSWRGAFRIFPCDFDPSPDCGGAQGGYEPILLPIPEDPLAAVCVE